jgi:hypothetical protein
MSLSDRLPVPQLSDAPWRYFDFTKSRVRAQEPPAPGEVRLWLVPTEFRFASASNIGNWLSASERKRARLHPNSALGRRFGVARATLRLVLSNMLGCEPQDVIVDDEPDERVVVTYPHAERALHVDVAYSGIWIVIAVASARIGLGLTVETAGASDAARAATWNEAAQIAKARAERPEARDGARQPHWHSLSLPMPGEICGVLVADAAIEGVEAFGWERPVEAAGSA